MNFQTTVHEMFVVALSEPNQIQSEDSVAMLVCVCRCVLACYQ